MRHAKRVLGELKQENLSPKLRRLADALLPKAKKKI
jgi:hypothetical protein